MASVSEPANDEQDLSALGDFLCFSIYSAGHAFNQFYRPLLDRLGLTYPQYLVLSVLWAGDGRTVGELGQALFLESSTLTPLLKRLEGMGYLTRTRDPADERQVRVRLTPSGAALKERAAHVPQCVIEATGLSLGDVTRLRAQIGALRDQLLARAP